MKALLLLSLLVSGAIHAQENISDDDIALANEVINTPAMNIEGTYKVPEPTVIDIPPSLPTPVVAPAPAPKKLTMSDKLRLRRARLEERNRIMMEKKLEKIRFQQELMLAKQLESQLNKTFKAIDSIE